MSTVVSRNFVTPGTQIAAAATEYVTAASNEKIIIDKAVFHNTGGSSETIKGYVAATSVSPAAATQVFEFSIPAGESRDSGFPVNIRLNNSQALYLLTTTATTVNMHISGRRIVG